MPVATIYLYGNLPVDIEFNRLWEPLEATVHTNMGVKFLDMTDAELFKLCDLNAATIKDQLTDGQISKAAWRSSKQEDELKAGDAW